MDNFKKGLLILLIAVAAFFFFRSCSKKLNYISERKIAQDLIPNIWVTAETTAFLRGMLHCSTPGTLILFSPDLGKWGVRQCRSSFNHRSAQALTTSRKEFTMVFPNA